jgi:hypothetical protein
MEQIIMGNSEVRTCPVCRGARSLTVDCSYCGRSGYIRESKSTNSENGAVLLLGWLAGIVIVDAFGSKRARIKTLLVAVLVGVYFFLFGQYTPRIEMFLGPFVPPGLGFVGIVIVLALIVISRRFLYFSVGLFLVLNVLNFLFFLAVVHPNASGAHFTLFSLWPWGEGYK